MLGLFNTTPAASATLSSRQLYRPPAICLLKQKARSPVRSRAVPNGGLFFPVYIVLLFLSSCATSPDAVQGATVSVQATLPSGFSDTLLFSVAKPTALAFTPDSQALFITTQPGRLYVRQSGRQRLVYTVRNLCSDSERGLLGVATDPNFA
jgi:glucose/arabinose dehydrogenase